MISEKQRRLFGRLLVAVEIIDSRHTSGLVLTKRRAMFSSSFSQQHAHTSTSSRHKLYLLP